MKTISKNASIATLLLIIILSCSVSNNSANNTKNTENQELTDSMKIEKRHAHIIREADEAFDNENYQLAISKYRDALYLKNEAYPKYQIQKINQIIYEEPRKTDQSQKLGRNLVPDLKKTSIQFYLDQP